MVTSSQTKNLSVPKYVNWVVEKLSGEGFEVYLVGGAVRDLVIGREPKDFDLATNAKPKQTQKIFPDSIAIGAAFGIITVLAPGDGGENFEVEVATYRTEADYVDGRWPTKVEFTDDISRDLGRRDFTVNAMAYPLHVPTSERKLLDPFDGQKDLEKKVIRAVGDPVERMKEDGLRGYRACRMASNWGFELEPELKSAIKKTLSVAKKVSMERVRDEFVRLLMSSPKPSVGIELLREVGLLELFLPELLEGLAVKQRKVHVHNVYEHILRTVDKATDDVKLAALFHDIGKPQTKSDDGEHFYGHEMAGARLTEKVMRRLKFPNAEIKKVKTLVKNHMFWYQEEWTDAAVRRLLRRVGGEDMFELLLELRMADSQSNPKADFKPWVVEKLQGRVSEIKKEEMALKVSDLDIGGGDVIKLGVPKDIRVRAILGYLLDLVVDDPSLNNREYLAKEVKKYIEHDCELLWLVDENDEPVKDMGGENGGDKGYLEDAKTRGLCYRCVRTGLASAGTSARKPGAILAHVFPGEPYEKAAKRVVWESSKKKVSVLALKPGEHVKEKDSEGVCRWKKSFIAEVRNRDEK